MAAGGSARLGRPKQLVEYRGRPLLQSAIDAAEGTNCHPKVLVLGAYAEEIKDKVDTKTMEVVINTNWKDGLSSSLRTGVNLIESQKEKADNILFMLGDQPYVDAEILNGLLDCHRRHDKGITACGYQGEFGVPMILNHKYVNELQTLRGDQGAKKIVMKHTEDVYIFAFGNGTYDIDTEDDLGLLE